MPKLSLMAVNYVLHRKPTDIHFSGLLFLLGKTCANTSLKDFLSVLAGIIVNLTNGCYQYPLVATLS